MHAQAAARLRRGGSVRSYNVWVTLRIALVGSIAKMGKQLLSEFIKTPCEIREFPCNLDDIEVLAGYPVTPGTVAKTPRLRLVHSIGAGTDAIATWALPAGVQVSNTYHHEHAIAEYILLTMLAFERDLIAQDRRFRQRNWEGSCVTGPPMARELRGLVLGLVGFGHIGRETARLAEAFGVAVRALRSNHTRADLEELLRSSDHVALACPLTEQTRGMIGEPELRLMKPAACLINVARAEVVQEEALYQALRGRTIRGAALDVWYRYPKAAEPNPLPCNFPFHELDNVIMTPHSSCWTDRCFSQRFADIAANIDRLARGEAIENVVFTSKGPQS